MTDVEKLNTAVQAALSLLQERDVRIINLCVDLANARAELAKPSLLEKPEVL